MGGRLDAFRGSTAEKRGEAGRIPKERPGESAAVVPDAGGGDHFGQQGPELVGRTLDTGIGQKEGPGGGHVQIDGVLVPVEAADLIPAVGGLLGVVPDGDAVILFGQVQGVDPPGLLKAAGLDLLLQGAGKGGKVDCGKAKAHQQQGAAQKHGSPDVVHDKADTGAGAQNGGEDRRGTPLPAVAQQVKQGKAAEHILSQNHINIHSQEPPGRIFYSIAQKRGRFNPKILAICRKECYYQSKRNAVTENADKKGQGDEEMTQPHMPKLNLMARVMLFVAGFAGVLMLQIGIGRYQSFHVLKPMEQRMENIQAISQFLNHVEGCMTTLEDYRWDYGDPAGLITTVREYTQASGQSLAQIQKELSQVGEEQYLLANAAQTTHGALVTGVEQIIDYLLTGRSGAAAELYYSRIEPCGTYLRQYTQQLLEQAILDNQDAYTALAALNAQLNRIQAVVMMACLVLGCVMIYSLMELLQSVGQMAKASQAISRGDFDTPDVQVEQEDEIGHLARTFNEMKHSMKQQMHLLEEKNEMERRLHKKETEALEYQTLMEREKLQKLRSQINPHFLFNTLNVILYSSQQEGAKRTQSLIGSLSKLFRYALGSNEAQVPLAREVNIVDEFYVLQHARFGDRLKMRWNISAEVDLPETLVPSFIIQPLVENAFKHGIAPKEEGGCVDIFIEPKADMLLIRVVDDGVGMSREALEQLRQNLRNPPISGEHIGIYNVAARLKLWGKRYGMDIQSEPGKGTAAILRLPLVIQGQEEEEENGEAADRG